MNTHLLTKAVRDIWCNPTQDRLHRYRLSRITRPLGVRGFISLFNSRIDLPSDDTYHVYQIGPVLPSSMGVPDTRRRWISLAELAEEHFVQCDLYLDNGLMFPKFDSYMIITGNRSVFIAVKERKRIHTLENTYLYAQFRRNAFFDSDRSVGRRHLYVRGVEVTTTNDILSIQNGINQLMTDHGGGYPQYFVNGRFTQVINPITVLIGDVIEAILDLSIKRVMDFPIDDLIQFTSTLDSKAKYLLHHDLDVEIIEFFDDLSIYMVGTPRSAVGNTYDGLFYNQNTIDSIRMVTHRDYSIPVQKVSVLGTLAPEDYRHTLDSRWPSTAWGTAGGKTLKVFFRDSGYERPLVSNANRINVLYQLDEDDIVGALSAQIGPIELWSANALESSAYSRFMSATLEQVSPIGQNNPDQTSDELKASQELVGEVYGYYAAGRILADMPANVYVLDEIQYADLRSEHQLNSTVFEYDGSGKLIGWHRHLRGEYYTPRDSNARAIEVLTGEGGDSLTTIYGSDRTVQLKPGYSHRIYVRPMSDGSFTGPWEDITDADDVADYGYLDTTSTPNAWVWNGDPATYLGAVRQNDQILTYDLDLLKEDGHIRFSVNVDEDRGSGVAQNVLEIPVGQLDVFLNGHLLVEGIDYNVIWPEVVVNNINWHVDGNIQRVTVRGYGFCNPDMTLNAPQETGFVSYGVLSVNDTFNYYTNKSVRVSVGGSWFPRDNVILDEDFTELQIDGIENGEPYSIVSPPIAFTSVYDDDRAARSQDDARERAVQEFMDTYYQKRVRTEPDVISEQYPVLSPFANKLLNDLLNGDFDEPGIEGHYTEMDIQTWCARYEWLLPYDPAWKGYDEGRIVIHPHWYPNVIELDLYKFQFYTRAVRQYLSHPIQLNSFVRISAS